MASPSSLLPSFERLQSLHGEVLSDLASLRALQLRLGERLLELRRADRWRLFETTTFALYCEKVGLSVSEGRDLASVAGAAEKRPEVAGSLGACSITLSQACMVGEVGRRPELCLPGEDWLRFAEQGTTRDLREFLDRRKEQVRLKEDPLPLQLLVSRGADRAFRRCRELVSRSRGAPVTPSHAFEVVCEDYLERHDPEREAARLLERDTESKASLKGVGSGKAWANGKRQPLPEWVKREIVRRVGDRCWVKGCPERVFLQNAHLHPVRAGGSNFPWEMARSCRGHHAQFDGGLWFLLEKKDGTVLMMDRRGVEVGQLVRAGDILRRPPEHSTEHSTEPSTGKPPDRPPEEPPERPPP